MVSVHGRRDQGNVFRRLAIFRQRGGQSCFGSTAHVDYEYWKYEQRANFQREQEAYWERVREERERRAEMDEIRREIEEIREGR